MIKYFIVSVAILLSALARADHHEFCYFDLNNQEICVLLAGAPDPPDGTGGSTGGDGGSSGGGGKGGSAIEIPPSMLGEIPNLNDKSWILRFNERYELSLEGLEKYSQPNVQLK